MILKGKGRLRHILVIESQPGDPRFNAWNKVDSIKMEINNTCMFLPITKEVWEAVQETYFRVKDAAQIYNLKIKTWSIIQANM